MHHFVYTSISEAHGTVLRHLAIMNMCNYTAAQQQARIAENQNPPTLPLPSHPIPSTTTLHTPQNHPDTQS